MLREIDAGGDAAAVLADVRRTLEVHGWRPPREVRLDRRFDILDERRSLAIAVEYVVPMDGRSWREALEELARRTGLAQADDLTIGDLEAAIEGWENAPGRTLADVLRMLS